MVARTPNHLLHSPISVPSTPPHPPNLSPSQSMWCISSLKGILFEVRLALKIFQPSLKRVVITPQPQIVFASFHGPQNGQGRNQENYTRYTTLKPLALHFENFERTDTQPLNLWLCSSKMEKSGSRPISSAG